jgi:hypothetical protein
MFGEHFLHEQDTFLAELGHVERYQLQSYRF